MNQAVSVIFGISIVLTLWHVTEEYQGKLWRYFGAIAGVRIPDRLGVLVFIGGLGVLLVVAALGILAFRNPPFDVSWLSLTGVGFLLAGRVTDWWVSHLSKVRRGYQGDRRFRGNPGFRSAWFYLMETALLLFLLIRFQDVWVVTNGGPFGFDTGVLVGAGLFIFVIPIIRCAGTHWFRNAVRPEWEPHRPMPE